MCSPMGHALMGWSASMKPWFSLDHPRKWLSLPLIGILSVLPDFDFIPGYLAGNPNLYHHGWTHSLAFCFIVAGIGTVLAKKIHPKNYFLPGRVILFIILTHILLDVFSNDQSPPYGMPIFWPASGRYMMAPVPIFMDVYKSSISGTFMLSLINLHNLKTMSSELAILGPVTLLVYLWNRRQAHPAGKNP